jgi:hypothetical protein
LRDSGRAPSEPDDAAAHREVRPPKIVHRHLAPGRGKLRDRLIVALLCLGSSDGRDVSEELRPTYEAIREQLRQRAGIENELELARLRAWPVRCKIATAERLARDIMTMDRRLTEREA